MNRNITRRDLMKWTALLVGGGPALVKYVATAAPTTQGKWVPVACWSNCGGRCPNYAYVVDGLVRRMKADDTHPDSPDYPQQRSCARGHAQRFQAFGADRLKYPMKRRDWRSGGGNKGLRGQDDWVRISWDEALDRVASEIKRVKVNYGNASILSLGAGEVRRTLALYGGFAETWGNVAYGAWPDTFRLIPCANYRS